MNTVLTACFHRDTGILRPWSLPSKNSPLPPPPAKSHGLPSEQSALGGPISLDSEMWAYSPHFPEENTEA